MIYVIATVEVVSGQREQFLDEFRRLVPHVLKEQGCIFYGPSVDLATGFPRQIPLRDNTVTIVESWDSLESLKAHMNAPHMAPYREKVKDIVVGTQLQVLTPQ